MVVYVPLYIPSMTVAFMGVLSVFQNPMLCGSTQTCFPMALSDAGNYALNSSMGCLR